MSQIIFEQQFHYTAKMTSRKHFPNAIYANRDAKLLPAMGGKACIAHKIFINSAPGLRLNNGSREFSRQ